MTLFEWLFCKKKVDKNDQKKEKIKENAIIKTKKEKKKPQCSYCKSYDHNIKTCENIEDELIFIKYHFDNTSFNKLNDDFLLNGYSMKVLNMYYTLHIKKVNIRNNYADYYDKNIKKLKNKNKCVAMIIFYHRTMPFINKQHRPIKQHNHHKKTKAYDNNNDDMHLNSILQTNMLLNTLFLANHTT